MRRLLLTLVIVLATAGCNAPTPPPLDEGGVVTTTTEPTASTTKGSVEFASGGYVAPVFHARSAVEEAAEAGDFAKVNPIGYDNPWR